MQYFKHLGILAQLEIEIEKKSNSIIESLKQYGKQLPQQFNKSHFQIIHQENKLLLYPKGSDKNYGGYHFEVTLGPNRMTIKSKLRKKIALLYILGYFLIILTQGWSILGQLLILFFLLISVGLFNHDMKMIEKFVKQENLKVIGYKNFPFSLKL